MRNFGRARDSEDRFKNVTVVLDGCAQLGNHTLWEIFVPYANVADRRPVESYSRLPISSEKRWA